MNAKPVIGLVGGIGSGKSAVAAELVKHGGCLVNADHLGHEALRQADLKKQIVAHFGRDILDGEVIDRKKLGAKVFADRRELRALEAFVFPFIGERIHAEIVEAVRRDDVRFLVLDAAVMLEAGWNGACDKLIFVEAPRTARVTRVLRQRGWSEADLAAREALQMPLDEKRRRADAVVDNSGAPVALAEQVAGVLQSWGVAP